MQVFRRSRLPLGPRSVRRSVAAVVLLLVVFLLPWYGVKATSHPLAARLGVHDLRDRLAARCPPSLAAAGDDPGRAGPGLPQGTRRSRRAAGGVQPDRRALLGGLTALVADLPRADQRAGRRTTSSAATSARSSGLLAMRA